MPRGFPLQDDGPGMSEMFHDLAVEQEQEWANRLGIKCCYPGGADQCPGCPHYYDPKKHPDCAYEKLR